MRRKSRSTHEEKLFSPAGLDPSDRRGDQGRVSGCRVVGVRFAFRTTESCTLRKFRRAPLYLLTLHSPRACVGNVLSHSGERTATTGFSATRRVGADTGGTRRIKSPRVILPSAAVALGAFLFHKDRISFRSAFHNFPRRTCVSPEQFFCEVAMSAACI